ncbi:MAG TPA: hypothetical protein DD989_23100 [Pseudomonas sp.]|nr:hypothetical protein [Pseudomonas sp.]
MRVSVTDLDQLRYYQNSDMELGDLLARLRRETPPTRAMAAGTAFHDLLEHSAEVELVDVEHQGFRFVFDLDAEIAIPTMREIKVEKVYRVGSTDVTLVGMVDAIEGGAGYDHKLTARFDAERYANAIQWRAYCDIFRCQRFTYNVFVAKDEGDRILVRSFEPLTFWTYPGLHRDLMTSLREFVDFAHEYLPERFEQAA